MALSELGRTQEAWENLDTASRKFPRSAEIHYKLACYACKLGRLEDASKSLEQVFDLGETKKLKLMALDEPDLEPLWRSLGESRG
jgi:tetratricopeptide (TPR) repeat protein